MASVVAVVVVVIVVVVAEGVDIDVAGVVVVVVGVVVVRVEAVVVVASTVKSMSNIIQVHNSSLFLCDNANLCMLCRRWWVRCSHRSTSKSRMKA